MRPRFIAASSLATFFSDARRQPMFFLSRSIPEIDKGRAREQGSRKITATGRGIPEGHPLPRRASPGQVYSGAREGGHPCPGRLQPGEGEAPPRPAVPGPHSARSSGDPPATQRLEGQEGEREVGSRESTNSCEEDPGEEVAPSIPQILRHRGTDPYCRLTPQHQEEKGPCDSLPHGTFFKTPPPLDRPVERPTYNKWRP
ncbi:unnamed protein product [Trichogramma brassicae]|uniref:Uncharacterized protein n=1 Tax=Trichogramma brassicae TaxID=86971 RepID=A0A6H5I9L2_9HYME|nr:unnamed protein product [Trichogramma brassicae]